MSSDVAIPAASFVIIRRLSLMIRRTNDIGAKRDVSELFGLTYLTHHQETSRD